jgi:hypothetical protein
METVPYDLTMPPASGPVGTVALEVAPLDIAPQPFIYAPLVIIVLLAVGVAVVLVLVLRNLRNRRR